MRVTDSDVDEWVPGTKLDLILATPWAAAEGYYKKLNDLESSQSTTSDRGSCGTCARDERSIRLHPCNETRLQRCAVGF
jgi:hypothetical protein